MRSLLVALLLVAPAAAAPVPKAVKKTDPKELFVGSWRLHRLDGQPDPNQYTYTFTGDGKATALAAGGAYSEWTYTLDPSATPPRITFTDKDNPRISWVWVYEMTSDRTLKCAYAQGGRPTPDNSDPAENVVVREFIRDLTAK